MTPKNGGKFDLKLGSATPLAAQYAAVLQTSGASFRSQASVAAEGTGSVEFSAWVGDPAGEPPEWLLADARAALKAALRSSRSDGHWPRRITRWRPEPND
jgi:hypothetical protein